MSKLKPCPFGKDHKVWIGVHDDTGKDGKLNPNGYCAWGERRQDGE